MANNDPQAPDAPDSASAGDQVQETPLLEWIVAAIGLILLSLSIGFLLYEAFQENDAEPRIVVQVRQVIPQGDRFLVEFDAANQGEQTAAGVAIEGQLLQGGESVETSSATITYIPAESTRGGGLFFTRDPAGYELELRATGYERP